MTFSKMYFIVKLNIKETHLEKVLSDFMQIVFFSFWVSHVLIIMLNDILLSVIMLSVSNWMLLCWMFWHGIDYFGVERNIGTSHLDSLREQSNLQLPIKLMANGEGPQRMQQCLVHMHVHTWEGMHGWKVGKREKVRWQMCEWFESSTDRSF